MHDWRETEALWRYGVIRDAVDERLTSGQRGVVVRELAAGCMSTRPQIAGCCRVQASIGGYAPTAVVALTR